MKNPLAPIWENLTEAQRGRVVAILVQILLCQQTKKEEKEAEKYVNGKTKGSN